MFRLNWFFTWTNNSGGGGGGVGLPFSMARHGHKPPGIGTRGR